MSIAVYLEEEARKYATKAVKADQEGDYDLAAKFYDKAAEFLEKLIKLYPDVPFKLTYIKMIKGYRERSEYLKKLAEKKVKAIAVGGEEEDEEDFENIILAKKPSITFNDIVDLEDAKQAIKEAIVYPVRRPDLFPLGWPRGILLFGPPGCGKTMIAAAVANEVDGVFFHVDAATIMSKWLGEAERNVAKIFRKAREIASEGKPAIIFIDEVDALLGVFQTEVGGEVRVRNQFLKEMDGLLDKSFNYHVYVIGATNKPWRLDEAFIRRFQKRIYIPPPNFEARLELFRMYTSKIKLAEDVDLYELAEKTDGYSASDIRDIVQAAYMRTVREFFEHGGEGEPRPVGMEDFLEVLKIRRPSIDSSMLDAYMRWYEKFKAL